MGCPCAHDWYELARGAASREQAERLRRHLADCPACRDQADDLHGVAASLERLSRNTRADLSPDAAESVYVRARVHGWLGRRPRRPMSVRLARARWLRWALPAAVTVAAAVIIAVNIEPQQDTTPRGALERLVRSAHGVKGLRELRRLAPMARAAVTEELARDDPSVDQVGDLLLVAYIAERPRQDRQAADVDFMLGEVWSRRPRPVAAAVVPPSWWPTLVASAQAAAEPPGASASAGGLSDPRAQLAAAKARLLDADYRKALEVLPEGEAGMVLKAWCLQVLGRTEEAAQVFAEMNGDAAGRMARVVRADLALSAKDVAEAMRQYEALAAEDDRYWFPAGYLCRYELLDARGAGVRFGRVRSARLAKYVSTTFQAELAAATVPEPAPLVAEDFEDYEVGPPDGWTLVRTRGGEFEVVEVPGGKALRQDEVRFNGAEFLCGEPDWTNYTLQVDVKVVATQGEFAIKATAYRRSDETGYMLELSPTRLRVLKQFASGGRAKGTRDRPYERLALEPVQAQVALDEAPAQGWWYTMKLRVQRVDGGVSVAGKVWRTDAEEPLGWQVVWTDTGQGGVEPLAGGAAGVQLSRARALFDNFSVKQNQASGQSLAAAP